MKTYLSKEVIRVNACRYDSISKPNRDDQAADRLVTSAIYRELLKK